jgi:hypothetical protein
MSLRQSASIEEISMSNESRKKENIAMAKIKAHQRSAMKIWEAAISVGVQRNETHMAVPSRTMPGVKGWRRIGSVERKCSSYWL